MKVKVSNKTDTGESIQEEIHASYVIGCDGASSTSQFGTDSYCVHLVKT